MINGNPILDDLVNNREEVLLLIREAIGQVAYYRRLLERYEVDTLTGLPGSNKYHEFIAGIETCAASVGVIFFDVNGLKFYNDTKGHQAGNLLLQKAAESILQITGENIHAFRIGGDEFVVVVTDCAESDLDKIIAKWHGRLEELNKVDDGIHCSVAVGAAFGSGDYKADDVIKLADGRMYTNKRDMKARLEAERVRDQGSCRE